MLVYSLEAYVSDESIPVTDREFTILSSIFLDFLDGIAHFE